MHDQHDTVEVSGKYAGGATIQRAVRCDQASLARLALRADVRRRALTLALVVGPVSGLINHGGRMLGGMMEAGDWLRFGLTFLVPYCVSTWSSVMAIHGRDRRSG